MSRASSSEVSVNLVMQPTIDVNETSAINDGEQQAATEAAQIAVQPLDKPTNEADAVTSIPVAVIPVPVEKGQLPQEQEANAGNPVESQAASKGLKKIPAGVNASNSAAISQVDGAAPTTKARLPHDTIGILEDRIADDPRGDLGAWLELINEHRNRGKLDEARKVYERFFQVFPTAVGYMLSQGELLY